MKLSDIMGQMGLASYAEVGLVIFLAVFVLVAIKTFSRAEVSLQEEARRLPLWDGQPVDGPTSAVEQENAR